MSGFQRGLPQCVLLVSLMVIRQALGACPTGQVEINGLCYAEQVAPEFSSVQFGWDYAISFSVPVEPIKTSIKDVYLNINTQLGQQGTALCDQADCSDLDISIVDNPDGDGLRVTITDTSIPNVVGDQTPLQDELKAPFDDGTLRFASISSPQTNNWVYNPSPFCNSGYQMIGSNCAQCAPGYYLDGGDKTCTLCPRGKYQDKAGQTGCNSCPVNEITYVDLADEEDDCKVQCIPGNFFDLTADACVKCGYGYYQDGIAERSCKPCGDGKTTISKGSTSSSKCIDECDSGYELQLDGTCDPCDVGTYLTPGLHRTCQSCESPWTTHSSASGSKDECNLILCEGGYFRETDSKCSPCLPNTYREKSSSDMSQCEPCPDHTRTDSDASDSPTDCKFYCDAGQHISGTKQCSPCLKDFYKSEEEYYATSCNPCSSTRQTRSSGSTALSDCAFAKCEEGQELNPSNPLQCLDCDIDFFQPDVNPIVQTCQPCSGSTGTRSKKSTECEAYCASGSEYSDSSKTCSKCLESTFKDNAIVGDLLARFRKCQQCPDPYTSEAGATSESDCNILSCSAGYYKYASTGDCFKCPLGQYQSSNRHTIDTCDQCPLDFTTSSTASTSKDDCTVPRNQTTLAFKLTVEKRFIAEYWVSNSAEFEQLKTEVEEEVSKTLQPIGSFMNKVDLRAIVGHTTQDTISVLHMSALFSDMNKQEDFQALLETILEEAADKGSIGSLSVDTKVAGYKDFNIIPVNPAILPCRYGCYLDYGKGDCKPCPLGEYNPYSRSDSIRVNDICVACPGDNTTEKTGSFGTSDEKCKLSCQEGTESANAACVKCKIGFYKDSPSVVACSECPNNRTTTDVGSTSGSDCIASCSEGHYRSDSGDTCIACPNNTYQDQKDQDGCKDCKPLYTTKSKGSVICLSPREVCEYDEVCGKYGTCEWNGAGPKTTCNCDKDHTGPFCEERKDGGTSDYLIYGLAGGGGFLFLIVVLVGLCWCCRKCSSGPGKRPKGNGEVMWVESSSPTSPFPNMHADQEGDFFSSALVSGEGQAVFQPEQARRPPPLMSSQERSMESSSPELSRFGGRRPKPRPKRREKKTTLQEANAKWNTNVHMNLAKPNVYIDNGGPKPRRKSAQLELPNNNGPAPKGGGGGGVKFASGVEHIEFDSRTLPNVSKADKVPKAMLKGSRKVETPENYVMPRVQVNNTPAGYAPLQNRREPPDPNLAGSQDNFYESLPDDDVYLTPVPSSGPGPGATRIHVGR